MKKYKLKQDVKIILAYMLPLSLIFALLCLAWVYTPTDYSIDLTADNEVIESIKLGVEQSNCFYGHNLLGTCEKGYLIPVTNKSGKFWTCKSLNYSVRAC